MDIGANDANSDIIALAASYLELCLLATYFAVLGLLIRVVVRRPQFHHNMLYLMTNMALHGVVAMAARTVLVAWTLMAPGALKSTTLFAKEWPLNVPEYIRVFGLVACVGNAAGVLLERTVATAQLRSYEQQRNRGLVVAIVVYGWLMGGVCVYLVHRTPRRVLYIVLTGGIYGIALIVLFIAIDRVNHCRHDRVRRGLSSLPLSQRFQLLENIKSLAIIRNTLLVTGVGSVSAMLVGLQRRRLEKEVFRNSVLF